MKLLLIGDERKLRRMAAWGFSGEPYELTLATQRSSIEEAIAAKSFHAACIDWKMEGSNAADLVAFLHAQLPSLPIIAMVGEKDRNLAPALKALGVSAQLVSPVQIEHLHSTLRTHATAEPVAPVASTDSASPFGAAKAATGMLVSDDHARRTLELALRAARSTAAILVLGETGTGKSLLAQTIHQNSNLRDKAFVTVNCPCLNRELLESDLFGHVRGSFTGAVQDTWGKVAAAEGGTLFLDEIGDLPMSLQPKLLRLLQEKQYERVGEVTSRTANVRIIAATNRDLKREVAAGRFREDLFYRLNVIAIDVPALRGRPSQIMGSAEAFLANISHQLGKPSPGFTAEARRLLEGYPWPGNLRELRNVIERAAILSSGQTLDVADFPALISHASAARLQIGGAISLHALEAAHIRMVVANSGSLEEAARILEIDKSTLYRKRKQMEAQGVPFDTGVESTAPMAIAAGD